MDSFISNKIENSKDLIGRELQQVRISQKVPLKNIAKVLGIRLEYLEALEDGNYEKLPQGLYGRNFLREYAKYLRLDEEKILQIYDENNSFSVAGTKEKIFIHKVPQFQYFITIPKFIKNALLVLGVLICLFYLGYYINNIIAPPSLIVLFPDRDMTVKNDSLTIRGSTEEMAEVTINDEKILIDKNGNYFKEISLKTGLNIINIVAQKKYSRKNIIERKIILEQ